MIQLLGNKMLKLTLIENWKDAYRFYTIWIYSFIIGFPSLWNELVAAGVIQSDTLPPEFKAALAVIGTVGIASRIVKQNLEKITQDAAAKLQAEQADSGSSESSSK